MTIKDKLLSLTRQLLPTGRAFRISTNSVNESVEKAFILSEERLYNDAIGILDTILPDNDNFTAENATRWEQRLGLITNDLVLLQDRKDAIKRKMNHPGDIKARQSKDYIENSLRVAGFDVYVHENIPEDSIVVQHGMYQQGEIQQGLIFNYTKLVNNILESKDENFDIGTNYKCCFYIGGNILGTFANVDIHRKDEFRQLILKLKPVQTVGILLINYV